MKYKSRFLIVFLLIVVGLLGSQLVNAEGGAGSGANLPTVPAVSTVPTVPAATETPTVAPSATPTAPPTPGATPTASQQPLIYLYLPIFFPGDPANACAIIRNC